MRQRFVPLIVSLSLLGMISIPAFAASSKNMDALATQVAQLQQQVSVLQSQVQMSHKTKITRAKHRGKSARKISVTESSNTTNTINSDTSGVANLPTTGSTYLPVDVDVPGQSFVSSGPYIGIPLQFSGSNLIINEPSVNQDVALLKVRNNINTRLRALGVPEEQDHSHLLFSGIVEGQALYQNINGGSDTSDIDLTNVTLDAYVLGPTPWVSALISMTYDNFPGPATGVFANNARALNSRLFLREAFVTVGDFEKTPVYGTFGQMYVPFGTYSSNMVTATLTQDLARTKERAILLGYQPQADNALYASGYIFKGDSHTGSTSRLNNGGINLGYHFVQGNNMGDFGGGLIANIADSVGMQDVANSSTTFNGFGGLTGTGNEQIVHRVPALDLRGHFGLGTSIDLLAEYIRATTQFSSADMTMNSHGAQPQALNAEAAYTFNAFARPSSVAIGYGLTKDALALQLPARRYSLVFNTSIWKDSLQSLEFRHDIQYSASNVATGSGVAAPSGTAGGRSDNAVTAQFDFYF